MISMPRRARTPPARTSRCTRGAARGPRTTPCENGCGSPARTAFFRRNSIGSRSSARAIRSICALDGEEALRHTVAAERPGGDRVGVDRVGDEADVRDSRGTGRRPRRAPSTCGRCCRRPSSACEPYAPVSEIRYISFAVIVPSSLTPVFTRTIHRVARAGRDELLFAGVLEPHRAARWRWSGGRPRPRSSLPACRRTRRRRAA